MSPDFSLILACYNESEHILKSVPRILSALQSSKYKYEIIFIDDKSKDDTPKLIKKLVKENKNFRAYFHKKNVGRGGTVSEGIRLAKSNVVGYIDIDLEVNPVYIPYFVKIIKSGEADVAIAHRYYPSYFFPFTNFLRMILSKGYLQLGKKFLDLPVEDTEAGYKFFNKKKILPVLNQTKNKHWFWDTEIVARGLFSGLRFAYVPTLFLKREDKTSTVKLLPDTIHFLKSIYIFKKHVAAEKAQPPGILYKSPKLYAFVMKSLFGDNYSSRYKSLTKEIDKFDVVLDVCCGDSKLFDYLKKKHVDYIGVDISLPFVRHALHKKVRAIHADINKDKLPKADIVVMQGSLYQFENPKKIIDKLLKSTSKKLIISESVTNLTQNKFFDFPITQKLASTLVGTNHSDQFFRFTEDKLKSLLKSYKPRYVSIPGQRDIIAIIEKKK